MYVRSYMTIKQIKLFIMILFLAYLLYTSVVIAMLYMYCLGPMIVEIDADNMYHVISDDKGCRKHPCLYLSYLIDNHQDYFTFNAKIIFSETGYYIYTDMIIRNVFNFSLISFSLSEIVCSPQRIISFHNVVNLTIENMFFTKCGNSVNNSLHQAYWASINAPMYISKKCLLVIQSDMA